MQWCEFYLYILPCSTPVLCKACVRWEKHHIIWWTLMFPLISLLGNTMIFPFIHYFYFWRWWFMQDLLTILHFVTTHTIQPNPYLKEDKKPTFFHILIHKLSCQYYNLTQVMWLIFLTQNNVGRKYAHQPVIDNFMAAKSTIEEYTLNYFE